MTAATAVVDMCSGTGEFSAALQATLRTPTTLTSLSDANSRPRTPAQGGRGGPAG